MIRPNTCDNCKRTLSNKEKVTVIIPNVEVTDKLETPDSIRLKLSKYAITERAIKVYCSNCLNTDHYIHEED